MIHLIRLTEKISVTVISCKVSIFRTIYYYGLCSHLIAILNGLALYVTTIERDECTSINKSRLILQHGIYRLSNIEIGNIDTRTLTLASTAELDGDC